MRLTEIHFCREGVISDAVVRDGRVEWKATSCNFNGDTTGKLSGIFHVELLGFFFGKFAYYSFQTPFTMYVILNKPERLLLKGCSFTSMTHKGVHPFEVQGTYQEESWVKV